MSEAREDSDLGTLGVCVRLESMESRGSTLLCDCLSFHSCVLACLCGRLAVLQTILVQGAAHVGCFICHFCPRTAQKLVIADDPEHVQQHGDDDDTVPPPPEGLPPPDGLDDDDEDDEDDLDAEGALIFTFYHQASPHILRAGE